MFTFFIILSGGLLLIAVLVFVVGSFLPDEYLSDIRHASKSSAEEVWSKLSDPKVVSYGGRQCRKLTVLSAEGEPLRWREDLGPSKATHDVVESTPNARFVSESTDSVVPMTMRREVQLTPSDSGTTVTVSQRIHVRSGTWHVPIFRLMMWLGAADAGVKDYLRRLAAQLGEKPELQ